MPLGIERTVELLSQSDDPKVREALRAGIGEPDSFIQAMVISTLLTFQDAEAPRLIIEHLERLKAPAQAVLREEADAVRGYVRRELRKLEGKIRENAIKFLAMTATPETLELLVLGLTDPDEANRETASAAILETVQGFRKKSRKSTSSSARRRVEAATTGAVVRSLAKAFELYPEHGERSVFEAVLAMGEAGFAVLSRHLKTAGGLKVTDPCQQLIIEELLSSTEPDVVYYIVRMFLDNNLIHTAKQIYSQREEDQEFLAEIGRAVARLDVRDYVQLTSRVSKVPWLDLLTRNAEKLDRHGASRAFKMVVRSAANPIERGELLERLWQAPHTQVREQILDQIKSIDKEIAWRLIHDALADEHGSIQLAAVQFVLKEQPSDQTDLLRPLLNSTHPPVRSLVAQGLAEVGLERYLQTFDQMSPEARAKAARVLAKIDPVVVERVAAELSSMDPRRKVRSLLILRTLNEEKAAEEQLKRLMTDTDPRVRATTVGFLSEVATPETIAQLIASLKDPDRRVRANVIEALEHVNSPHVEKLLIPFIEHPDNRIRGNALMVLWRKGHTKLLPVIERMLEGDEELMRLTALWLVGELGIKQLEHSVRRLSRGQRPQRVKDRAQRTLELLAETA